ncbi:hypothetical protein [Actinomadura macrotermitis]|uniref:Uncharacterized protein n=1 Tax=Actinomadura macrotermitis TaxID=2585200 RepID=A0A7K0C6U1_9ACTN|nr:hypothetical protein [Actinomadura macrotermitis]MQY09189.1 hypothetical protein [Actinomadura macrotermitis]
MTQTITGGGTAALDELGAALAPLGYLTVLLEDGARPRLEVLDRRPGGRSGGVVCDGDWYWWPWADRIAPAGDAARAAALVDRGLRQAA